MSKTVSNADTVFGGIGSAFAAQPIPPSLARAPEP